MDANLLMLLKVGLIVGGIAAFAIWEIRATRKKR